jgi:signal transduction histidine kinase
MTAHQPRTAMRRAHALAHGVLGRFPWMPAAASRPSGGRAAGRGFAGHALRLRDRGLAWVRRHPLAVDAALAALVVAASLPPVSDLPRHHQVPAVALILAVVCPLVWRRRAPFGVLVIIFALAAGQFFTTGTVNDDLALLVAFYTVAGLQPPRRVLAATVILAAGATLLAVSTRHALAIGLLLAFLVGGAGFLGLYARTRRAYLASLVDRASRLERERDQQAQLAAAGERARIAREMHDIVAHNIAVIIALAEGASATVASDPGQAATLMGEVSATGRAALTEMRRLLGVLRQQTTQGHAPQPTLASLDGLLAAVVAAGVPARLTVTGPPFPLPPSAQLALYRIIQEALTNTLKHAPGASAQVNLAYLPGAVGLEVTDDGRPGAVPAAWPGAVPAGRPGGRTADQAGALVAGRPGGPSAGQARPDGHAGGGHGIAGMAERAAVFGGTVSAGPRTGGGWRVHTLLTLSAAPVTPSAAPVTPSPAPAGGEGA